MSEQEETYTVYLKSGDRVTGVCFQIAEKVRKCMEEPKDLLVYGYGFAFRTSETVAIAPDRGE